MKKVKLYSAIILCILAVYFLMYFDYQQNNVTQCKYIYYFDSPVSNVFNKNMLIRMLNDKQFLVLTIGITDCKLCKETKLIFIPDSFKVSRTYYDIKFHKNNLLLSQAFNTRGFPTSYVVDKNKNIIGIIEGNLNFSDQLNEIINYNQKMYSVKIQGNVDSTKTLPVLNNSFKALLASLDNDKNRMYQYALKSKQYGRYFFNNFMLYSYFKSVGRIDSMCYYKKQALKYNYGINRMIYKSLIDSLSN